MSNSAFHSDQDAADGIHVLHNWIYATEAARLAHTPVAGSSAAFVPADVGKVAAQLDTLTWWLLTNIAPVTWVLIGTTGGTGDVVGPGAATDGAVALFDGATGKLLKNSAMVFGGGVLDLSAVGLTLPTSTNPTSTAEGRISWDSDDDVLKVGTGAAQIIVGPQKDPRDILIRDHFVSGNPGTTNVFGTANWRVTVSGTGAAVAMNPPEAGRPGIARLEAGTAAAGRSAVHLGDTTVGGNFLLNAAQNTIEVEALVRFSGSLLLVDREFDLIGFGSTFLGNGEHADGIYIQYNPSVTGVLQLVTSAAGVKTVVSGTTTILLDVWYRLGIVVTFPGGVPTAQLRVNGVAEGTAITTNIPSVAVGFGFKIEAGASVTTEAVQLVDYVLVSQNTTKP